MTTLDELEEQLDIVNLCEYDFKITEFRRILNEVAERVKRFYENALGEPIDFRNLVRRYYVAHIEPIRVRVMDKGRVIGNMLLHILGIYDPNTRSTLFNSTILNDEDLARAVVAHESVHAIQDYLYSIHGLLKDYGTRARNFLEGMASDITDRLGYKLINTYRELKSFYRRFTEDGIPSLSKAIEIIKRFPGSYNDIHYRLHKI